MRALGCSSSRDQQLHLHQSHHHWSSAPGSPWSALGHRWHCRCELRLEPHHPDSDAWTTAHCARWEEGSHRTLHSANFSLLWRDAPGKQQLIVTGTVEEACFYFPANKILLSFLLPQFSNKSLASLLSSQHLPLIKNYRCIFFTPIVHE